MNGEVTYNADADVRREEREDGTRDITIYAPAAIGVIGRTQHIGDINPEMSLADMLAAYQDELRQVRVELRRQQTVNGTLAKAACALVREIQRRDQVSEVRIKKSDWGQKGSITVSADADEGLILTTQDSLDGPEWDGRSE